MKHILSKLQIARHFIALLRDYNNTENVFLLVEELNRHESLMAKFPKTPAIKAFVDAPVYQGFPSLMQLRRLPHDSLGWALAAHMDQLGVDFEQFDRKAEPESEHEIIDRHVFETHDVWHALTGFGTGPANEIGLQAFTLAQMEGVPSLTLVTLSMLRIFAMGGGDVAPLFDAITAGWTQGRAAKAIFGVDWRPHFHRPLADVRAEFGIVAVEAAELVEISETLAA